VSTFREESISGLADAPDFLVKFLQLQIEQFAPNDPLFDALAEKRLPTGCTLLIEALQIVAALDEPFVDRGKWCHGVPPQDQDSLQVCSQIWARLREAGKIRLGSMIRGFV
jgi:hypothetical protein